MVLYLCVWLLATVVMRADQQPTAAAHRTDLVALEMGGRIAHVPSEYDHRDWGANNLLGTLPYAEGAWSSANGSFPKDFPPDVAMSFFARQPALVAAVVIRPHCGDSVLRFSWC